MSKISFPRAGRALGLTSKGMSLSKDGFLKAPLPRRSGLVNKTGVLRAGRALGLAHKAMSLSQNEFPKAPLRRRSCLVNEIGALGQQSQECQKENFSFKALPRRRDYWQTWFSAKGQGKQAASAAGSFCKQNVLAQRKLHHSVPMDSKGRFLEGRWAATGLRRPWGS